MIYFRIFLVVCLFSSFPALAESSSYTLSELSLSFFVGLSIPVIVIALLCSVNKPSLFVFPTLLTISLAFFVGCVSQYTYSTSLPEDRLWLCSAANAYIVLLFLMPNRSDWIKELGMGNLKWLSLLIGLLSIGFEISLIAFSSIDHNLVWLGWFISTAFIAYIRSYFIVQKFDGSYSWLLASSAASFVTGLGFWLWINNSIDELSFYLLIGTAFTLVMGLFVRSLLKYPPTATLDEEEEFKREDWQLYARDAVTNFPLQGQAIKKLEYGLLNSEQKKFAAIAFKPVNFAQANKILGYENSDALLLQLAYSMQKQSLKIPGLVNLSFGQTPFYVARLHSLHFLIVIDLTTNKYDDNQVVEHVCKQLTAALPQAMTFKSYTMSFELAFGVSLLSQGDNSVKQAISLAEDALLKAEHLNKPIYFFDQSISQISKAQLVKMERLKACVDDNGFEYLIQPQINLISKDVIGYEVIVRWAYSKAEDLSQTQIQELAAQSGDSFKVFQLLLQTALSWLKVLEENDASKPVSINFESLELLDEVTVEHIEKQLKQAQLPANNLMISISEHLLLSVGDRVKVAFDQLRQIGVLLSINDFSGSYEALRYVRRLTVDQIRISCKSLTYKDDREPEKAIINALIHLASVMNLPLVGTQVNSASVELLFRELAGENAQGEIIAPAVPFSEANEWLSKWLAYNQSLEITDE